MADSTLTAYRHLVVAQVRSQAQYRASFAVDVAGSVLFGVLDIMSVVVLFRVTPALGGFGFAEVFLMRPAAPSRWPTWWWAMWSVCASTCAAASSTRCSFAR